MCMSGHVQIGEGMVMERRIMPSVVLGAPTGCSGAVAGTSSRPTSALRSATGTPRATATATWASASRGLSLSTFTLLPSAGVFFS